MKLYTIKFIILSFSTFYLFLFFSLSIICKAQESSSSTQFINEFLRRSTFSDKKKHDKYLMIRSNSGSLNNYYMDDSILSKKRIFDFDILPIFINTRFDGKRPYVGYEYGMIPSKGFQGSFSFGFEAQFSILNIRIQPEVLASQNLPFDGFSDTFSQDIISSRFLYWNMGDNPEKFGRGIYSKGFFGQSSVSLRHGSFELGVGTKNFWWGPGQWNSLIFSSNAPGFPYASLNTTKPATTFLGTFEGQVLIGRLESSNFFPTQSDSLNDLYFKTLNTDWRYLNGMMVNYNPKWIPNLSIGFARTFQYYNKERPNDFFGWFPIFEAMSKEKLFVNGNAVTYDDRKQSQQISIFGRYKNFDSKLEIYFQFGRRDHALDWREFFLNPEHARAYQVGFLKLVSLPIVKKIIQIRGEITHQQESINRIIRYGRQGGITWHTHGQLRGFTNFGQPMGVGIGTGSNVQTLEFALVDNWNKLGILFERLENNQDFYNKALGQQFERKPWIDWTTSLMWNTSYNNIFFSTMLQGTYARNYQWGLSEKSTPEFPLSHNVFSVHGQVNLIYFWNRRFNQD